MQKRTRFIIIFESLILFLAALFFFFVLLFPRFKTAFINFYLKIQASEQSRIFPLIFLIVLMLIALSAALFAIFNRHYRRSRLLANKLGFIDVSKSALEAIALNAVKAAQSGVKSAKANIEADKDRSLDVELFLRAYADVELPAMMSRVQERVQKDLQRYTGLNIVRVNVQVVQVEEISTRVER